MKNHSHQDSITASMVNLKEKLEEYEIEEKDI